MFVDCYLLLFSAYGVHYVVFSSETPAGPGSSDRYVFSPKTETKRPRWEHIRVNRSQAALLLGKVNSMSKVDTNRESETPVIGDDVSKRARSSRELFERRESISKRSPVQGCRPTSFAASKVSEMCY